MMASNSKYSSIEHQKLHEYEYKKFLKTLPNNNSSEKKFLKHQQIYFNNNYLIQRQINLQYRQDKRKSEYERIQKENLKFTQRLINVKSILNRYEQQIFFDKHCKLKQRLQHYPDVTQNQRKKSDVLLSSKNHLKIINKPIDSSFLIYNDKTILNKQTKPPLKNEFSSSNIIHWNKLINIKNLQQQSSSDLFI